MKPQLYPSPGPAPVPARRPVLLVVHGTDSRPGRVGRALAARGHALVRACPRAGDPLPHDLTPYAGVVVFGGPMSANDDHLEFVRRELAWLPRVLAAGTPFLGICLGAQMLARVLGARVAPDPRGTHEIGYYRVTPTAEGEALFPAPLHVYHWHSEGFEVPPGARLLASGESFPNQAFHYDGAVYGVQFHPEMETDIMEWWMKGAAHKLAAPGAQPPDRQRAGHAAHAATMHAWLDRFLDTWLAAEENPAPANQ